MTFIVPRPSFTPPHLTGVGIGDFTGSFGSGRFGPRLPSSNIGFNPQINVEVAFGTRDSSLKASKKDNSGSNNSKGNGNGGSGSDNNSNSKRPGRPNSRRRPFIEHESKTASVEFNSGIVSGIIVNPLQGSDKNYSNLYVLSGEFLPKEKSNSGSLVNAYLSKHIYFRVLIDAQKNVNYRVDINFSQDDFYAYINAISAGLQLYYCVDSIIAYASNTNNCNLGMKHLRSKINAEILSQHALLKQYLENIPIPRNLNNFIRFMYQNFTFDSNPNSPVIRLDYKGCLLDCNSVSNGALSPELYDTIIENISNCTTVIAILAKTYSSTAVRAMDPSYDAVLYDKQFLSFWHNSNIVTSDSKKPISNSVSAADEDTQVKYGTFVDDLDGMIYACSSIVSNSTSQPGLWKSFNAFEDDWDKEDKTSIHVFKNNTLVGVSTIAHRIQSGIMNCPYLQGDEWFELNGFTPGSARVLTHSISNTEQAASLSINFLIDFS